MRVSEKRPGVALLSVILISSILITGAAIAFARAATERHVTASDLAFREALGVAETGVSKVVAGLRGDPSGILPSGGGTWVSVLEQAKNSSQTVWTDWAPWLFSELRAGSSVLVTRGAFLAKVTVDLAVPVPPAQQPIVGEEHVFDTTVTISCIGRTFAPSVAASDVTDPDSAFLAQRAVSTKTVVRWNDTYTSTTQKWVPETNEVDKAIFSKGSIDLSGSWGVIWGDVHSNSTITVWDNGGTITEGYLGATGGVLGNPNFRPPGSVTEPAIVFPEIDPVRAAYALLYQAYLTGKAPFDGNVLGYENSSQAPPNPAMALYIDSLTNDPANVTLWTHAGGVYYPPEGSLPTITYMTDKVGTKKAEKKTVPGLSLNGGTIRAKVIVIDGSLELGGNVDITADYVVVKGDISSTAGGGTIHGTVLLGGNVWKGTGNFHLFGSLLAAGSLNISGNLTVDHTDVGSVPYPGGTWTTIPGVSVSSSVHGAFLPDGSPGSPRTWRETLPSVVLGN